MNNYYIVEINIIVSMKSFFIFGVKEVKNISSLGSIKCIFWWWNDFFKLGFSYFNIAREFVLSLLFFGLEIEIFYIVVYFVFFIKDKFMFLFKNKESLYNFFLWLVFLVIICCLELVLVN